MKTKILVFTLLAFTLSACCDDSAESKAKSLGLKCINGYVYRVERETLMFGSWKTTLTPLNIECPSGKVEVN